MLDEVSFRIADRGVIARLVAEPPSPGKSPQDSDKTKEDEDGAPGKYSRQVSDQHRGKSTRQMSACEEQTLDASSLARRDPASEDPRCVGPCACFSYAEQKPDCQQSAVGERCGGHHGESRPPKHDAREHAAASSVIGPARGWDFEDRVSKGEGAEDVTHLNRSQPQFAHDVGSED